MFESFTEKLFSTDNWFRVVKKEEDTTVNNTGQLNPTEHNTNKNNNNDNNNNNNTLSTITGQPLVAVDDDDNDNDNENIMINNDDVILSNKLLYQDVEEEKKEKQHEMMKEEKQQGLLHQHNEAAAASTVVLASSATNPVCNVKTIMFRKDGIELDYNFRFYFCFENINNGSTKTNQVKLEDLLKEYDDISLDVLLKEVTSMLNRRRRRRNKNTVVVKDDDDEEEFIIELKYQDDTGTWQNIEIERELTYALQDFASIGKITIVVSTYSTTTTTTMTRASTATPHNNKPQQQDKETAMQPPTAAASTTQQTTFPILPINAADNVILEALPPVLPAMTTTPTTSAAAAAATTTTTPNTAVSSTVIVSPTNKKKTKKRTLKTKGGKSSCPSKSNKKIKTELPIEIMDAHGEKDVLSGVALRIFIAVCEMYTLGVLQPQRHHVALMSGYGNVKSTGFAKALTTVKQQYQLIEFPSSDTLCLSQLGIATLPATNLDTPKSNYEMKNRLLQFIKSPKAEKIYNALSDGQVHDRTELAASVGYTNVKSTGFAKVLTKLSALNIAHYPDNQTIQLTDIAFPYGRPGIITTVVNPGTAEGSTTPTQQTNV